MEETTVTRSIYYYDLYELKKKDNEDSYTHSSKLIMKLLKDIYDKQKSADTYRDFLQPHSSGADYFIIVDFSCFTSTPTIIVFWRIIIDIVAHSSL